MTYRKGLLAPGEYFHVYNRGNSKQPIFLDDKDRDRFVKLLYLLNSKSKKNFNFRDDIQETGLDAWDFKRGEPLVSIGAWVLMPNHFHLYLFSPTPEVGENGREKSPVTVFMQRLLIGYSKYFNKKYNRTGGLFEGRYKSTHVGDDIQAKYLFSYIHLNPLKLIDPNWRSMGSKNPKLAFDYILDYRWSSFPDYVDGNRREGKIIMRESFPDYFTEKNSLKNEILEWINYN